MQVELFKKSGTYVNSKDNKEKGYVNFYLRCGSSLVPINVCFFPNESGKDPQYISRKEVLKAFATDLPTTSK